MFDILPPLWMRAGMFAMREFMTGDVTSVFFALSIDGRKRFFHAYCDLADRGSPERTRAAIVERESLGPFAPCRAPSDWSMSGRSLTTTTAATPACAGPSMSGIAHGHVYGGRHGSTLEILDRLTDERFPPSCRCSFAIFQTPRRREEAALSSL